MNKIDFSLRDRKVFIPALGEHGLGEEVIPRFFHRYIIVQGLGGNAPPDQVEETGAFHTEFHPPFKLQRLQGIGLGPGAIHTWLIVADAVVGGI